MAAIKFNCPLCGKPLGAPQASAGLRLLCPYCQQQIEIPALSPDAPIAPLRSEPPPPPSEAPPASGPDSVMSTSGVNSATEALPPRRSGEGPVCNICFTPLAVGEEMTACPACKSEYHTDCWQEVGGCAVYGCSEVPQVEQRHAVEIPVSFWGQEDKPCPACGREILAAAVRCRHCGATFSSQRPEDSAEFQARADRAKRMPETKRAVLRIFVLCVVPCVAPVGLIAGLYWYPSHKEDLAALPSLFPALCKIGLGVAGVQITLFVLMAALYSLFHGH